jgi:MFS family permease
MTLAFVLAALTLTASIQIWHVFVVAALLGISNAFDIPTRQAFVAEMVGKADLLNAIALNSSMFNGARIVGPAIAGVLVATIGEGWCFFINASSYTAVIAGLLLMRVKPREQKTQSISTLASIAEGFAFVGRTSPIRALLLFLGFVSLIGMPYAVLMPIFADRILKGGARGLGVLMMASGVGALLAALTLAARKSIRGLGRWVAYSSAGFGACLFLFSFSTEFWLSAVLLIPIGFCMMTQMASSNTLVQAMVPDNLRGRVMAIYSMMFMGMAPFGALLAGWVAGNLGAPLTVRIGGTICVLGAIIFKFRFRQLRNEGRQIIVALQTAGGEPSEEINGQIVATTARNT